MRLIDADALSKRLRDISTRQRYEKLLCKEDKYPTVADVIEEICCDLDGTSLNGFDNAPTVAERPKGKWELYQYQESRKKDWYCTACTTVVKKPLEKKYIFCPYCGADMRGDV